MPSGCNEVLTNVTARSCPQPSAIQADSPKPPVAPRRSRDTGGPANAKDVKAKLDRKIRWEDWDENFKIQSFNLRSFQRPGLVTDRTLECAAHSVGHLGNRQKREKINYTENIPMVFFYVFLRYFAEKVIFRPKRTRLRMPSQML